MNGCDHYIKFFSDLLDKTIRPTDNTDLHSHLEQCPKCRAQLDDLRSMKKSLASLPRPKTSDSFDVVLHAKIRQEMRYKKSRNWSFSFFDVSWKTPAYAVVAILLMFIGAQFQRFSSFQSYAAQDKRIAVSNVLNGEINYVKPGILVVSDVDSVKNTMRVVNYPDVDRAATMEAYENGRLDKNSRGSNRLPNLKEAPQNTARITQTATRNKPKISQVEFVF